MSATAETVKDGLYVIEDGYPARRERLHCQNSSIWKEERLMPKLREATLEDYKEWLRGYLSNGFKATDYTDEDFEEAEFYVAEEDFILCPLQKGNAVNIIVPEDVEFQGGDIGGCNLYFKNYNLQKGGWVPVFPSMRVADNDV